MRVSVAVMAHPSRAGMVDELLGQLDRTATVVWDRWSDRWDTGRRSWLAYDPDADYHLVIQDDAIPCRDLVAGLEEAVAHVPAGSPLCLYLGRVRPYAKAIDRVLSTTRSDASWITMSEVCWGPAIVLPTEYVEAAVACGDRHTEIVNYDVRIGRYFVEAERPTYYPWPSLVDHHADAPSLVGHGKRRWAHKFLGSDTSALGRCWSGPVVEVTAREMTMRVRMKVGLSGYRDGKPWPPRGGIVDLPTDEALDMIAAGTAAEAPPEEPRPTPAVEAAVVEPEIETAAVLSTPAPRKRAVRKTTAKKATAKKAAPRRAAP